jgi:hypothetical protein
LFICDKCIDNYIISGNLYRLLYCPRSHGMCEDCKQYNDCYDLPTGSYAHKDSVIGKGQIQIGRATIGSLRNKSSDNPSRRY